ncbi:sensor histidine kinase [Cohnella cellulosilytica]
MTLYYCTIFIVFIGLLGGTIYRLVMNVMLDQILQYTEKIIEEKQSSIDTYFGQAVNLVQIAAGSQVLRDVVNHQDETDSVAKLRYQRQANDFFTDILRFNSKVKDILILNDKGYIMNQSGATVDSGYPFFEQAWFKKIEARLFQVAFLGAHPQDYYLIGNHNEAKVVSVMAPIYDLDRQVYLLCNLNIEGIESISNETRIEKTGFITIQDHDNKPVYKPTDMPNVLSAELDHSQYFNQEKGHFAIGAGADKYLVVYTTLTISKWRVVAYIPYSEIYEHTYIIRNIVLASILTVIVLIVLTSILVSARINKPLLRLMNKMQMIESGRTDVVLQDNSTIEIEKLTRRIDSMILNIRALTEDNFRYKLQNKDMELKILLSQINPHFLYNTLQSIKALAVTRKTDEISRMVTLIGNMLRYAINSTQNAVTIQEEVEHISNYLSIQNYRYPGKFKYEFAIPDELRAELTPKLILQPIVENAIVHAFPQMEEGLIRINVREDGADIRIEIVDNGKGMTQNEWIQLTDKLSSVDHEDGYKGGVGLRNVHQRIHNRYGAPYGVTIRAGLESGLCVSILIPRLRGAT